MKQGASEAIAREVGWPEPVVDLLEVLAASWRLVTGILILGALTTGLWIWLAPPFYVSSAVAMLMPREKPTLDISVNTPLLRTSEDAARRATAAPLMLPPQPGLYMELLRSDRVIAGIAADVRDVIDASGDSSPEELAVEIRDMVKVVGSEEGLLTISVTSGDRALAAVLANAFVDAGEVASRAIERNLVFEQLKHLSSAIAGARAELATDEAELLTFYATHGLLDPQQESTENLRQIRETSMLRDRLQRQLGERRLQFVDGEVGVQQLQRQIEIADTRLGQLQKRSANASSGEKYGVLLVAHDRLQERIRGRRDLLQTLDAQQMVFRVRADQPAGSLVTIKRAVASLSPAGPRKKRIVLVGGALSTALALLLAVLRRQWRSAYAHHHFRHRVRVMKRHMGMRNRSERSTG